MNHWQIYNMYPCFATRPQQLLRYFLSKYINEYINVMRREKADLADRLAKCYTVVQLHMLLQRDRL